MEEKQATSPKMHHNWLYFLDKDVETEFQLAYEKEIRSPLRFGIIISIISWLSGIPLFYAVAPEKAFFISWLTILVICPFFLFIIYATYKDRFKGWIHFIGALSNAWAGLFAIYICGEFPNGSNFTVPVLIFILFFGSYMVRLRWFATVAASFSYVLGFHLYMIYQDNLTSEQIIMNAFILWLTWLFAAMAGRVSELKDRIRFAQRKTIQEQSKLIEQEKEESEKLLLNILPPFVADRLKAGEHVIADKHIDASILFSDIVGFTNLSTDMSADELILLLSTIFSHFDTLTEQYELEKIKTVGDGYMVAGGLTTNKEGHLNRMAQLAIAMNDYIENDPFCKQFNLKIRIGINSGPVVAGVIGSKKFSYDLWGDAVNTGSRMEMYGAIGKICVSEVVKLRLEKHFEFEKREMIDMKGKGPTQSYFLTGVKEF